MTAPTETLSHAPVDVYHNNANRMLIPNIQHYLSSDKCVSLELIQENGEPYAVVSVYIKGISKSLPCNQFVFKDYSENEGLLKACERAGLVKFVRYVNTEQGFAPIMPVAELTNEYKTIKQ